MDLDALSADPPLELVGGAVGDDVAVVDDDDVLGQLVGLLEVLRRQQQGRAVADEAADDVPHAQPAAWVEPGGGLVEDEQARPADDGAREVEASPHAARVRLDHAIRGVDEVELLEQLLAHGREPPSS